MYNLSNQLRAVKMNPVAAFTRYNLHSARRELRQVALPVSVRWRMMVSRKHYQG